MKIIAITFKTVCVGFLVFVLFVNIINAQVFDFESINSDSLLTHVPKGIAGGGIVKDSIWKNYVDNIKSGDVITDPYVLNKITKVSPYKGYAGSWLDNVIVYEKDGVKYEIGEKESGYLAVAHLVSDSMKVWEVPDSFKYNGKMCHVPLINARPDIDINSRKIYDENPGLYNVNLTKVLLPYYTEEISGFSNFLSLKEVIFKESEDKNFKRNEFETIQLYSEVFSNCFSLRKVILPKGVDGLAEESFSNCTNLKDILLPQSLLFIENKVFSECDNLECIRIPAGVKSIGDKVLSHCPNLKEIIVDPENPYFDSRNNCNAVIDSRTNELIIGCNGTVIPNSVISIRENAFLGSGIEAIVIPESVTEIGSSAFSGCNKLRFVSLPPSLTAINDHTFNCCFELSSIALPANLKSIGDMAFNYCISMTELEIPASVDNIGIKICMNCPNIQSIKVEGNNKVYDSRNDCNAIIQTATDNIVLGIANTSIPKTVKSIGSYAFITSLIDHIYIPGNIIHIGVGAFSYCRFISSISVDPHNPIYDSRNNCNAIIETATNTLIAGCIRTVIPQSVTVIGKNAFHGGLTPVFIDLSDNIRVIDNYAFADCDFLNVAILPSSLDYIGDYAFANCNYLNYLRLNNIKSWGYYTFGSNEILNEVVFNMPVESIGWSAFLGCNSIKSIVLPEGLDSICSNAFYHCDKLEYIRFPSTLKYIGTGAFVGCSSLVSPILHEGLLHIDLSAFMYCHNITELDIPKSVETIYSSGGSLRNLLVLKLPSANALLNLSMPNCYNLGKIIIK